MQARIRSADLICYPMGSFYSSLLANILMRGATASRPRGTPQHDVEVAFTH